MISHKHKTIFIHIPKCGGQSIETAYLDDLGLEWQTRAPLLLRPNNSYLFGPPRLAHLLASEYTKFKYVTHKQYIEYYTFAVVRCPFSRVVSLYNFTLKYKKNINSFIEEWLKTQFSFSKKYDFKNHKYEGQYYFVRPQADYVFDKNGNLLVKDIFYLEKINKDFLKIQEKSGLKSGLKHINAPKQIRATIKDLSLKNIDTLRELYKVDFERFGYSQNLSISP